MTKAERKDEGADAAAHERPEAVSEADVKLWRSSILVRRLPGLAKLSDEQVRDIILADRKGTEDRKRRALVKTYPKTEVPLVEKPDWKDHAVVSKQVFTPTNPHEARTGVMRPDDESFCLSLESPYEKNHAEVMAEITSDLDKRCSDKPFFPPGTSLTIKEAIAVHYHLNVSSPEPAVLAAELAAISMRRTGGSQAIGKGKSKEGST